MFDKIFAGKICMDAHIFGKQTINLYLKLFSFTNSLLLCTGFKAGVNVNPDHFDTIHNFLHNVKVYEDKN